MKKSKYIIISMLTINLSHVDIYADVIKFTNFEAIEKKSFYRVVFLPALLGITAYLNKDTFIKKITLYPSSTCLLSYFIGSLLLDNYYQYKKINEILDILKRSEKINHYLLCAILLKNKSLRFKNNYPDVNQFIDEKIYEYSGFNIIEIEEFTSHINKKALDYLNKFDAIHFEFQLNDLANILVKENFSLNELISLFKNEPDIYQELLALQNNQSANIEKIIQTLGFKIKDEIQKLLEKN